MILMLNFRKKQILGNGSEYLFFPPSSKTLVWQQWIYITFRSKVSFSMPIQVLKISSNAHKTILYYHQQKKTVKKFTKNVWILEQKSRRSDTFGVIHTAAYLVAFLVPTLSAGLVQAEDINERCNMETHLYFLLLSHYHQIYWSISAISKHIYGNGPKDEAKILKLKKYPENNSGISHFQSFMIKRLFSFNHLWSKDCKFIKQNQPSCTLKKNLCSFTWSCYFSFFLYW